MFRFLCLSVCDCDCSCVSLPVTVPVSFCGVHLYLSPSQSVSVSLSPSLSLPVSLTVSLCVSVSPSLCQFLYGLASGDCTRSGDRCPMVVRVGGNGASVHIRNLSHDMALTYPSTFNEHPMCTCQMWCKTRIKLPYKSSLTYQKYLSRFLFS